MVSCRAPKKGYEYAGKDGDFIETGVFQFKADKRKWAEVLSASNAEEALQIVREVSPRDYVLQHDKITSYIRTAFTPELPEYRGRDLGDFNTGAFPELQQWIDQMDEADRPKSLILIGDSRTGKTEWARSVGHHMYWNSCFNLDKWDPEAQYAIFDDFEDWTRFYNYKQWLGAQREFEATDKYRARKTLLWGKPTVVLSNERPLFRDWTWIMANCFIVNIGPNKLYNI